MVYMTERQIKLEIYEAYKEFVKKATGFEDLSFPEDGWGTIQKEPDGTYVVFDLAYSIERKFYQCFSGYFTTDFRKIKLQKLEQKEDCTEIVKRQAFLKP